MVGCDDIIMETKRMIH